MRNLIEFRILLAIVVFLCSRTIGFSTGEAGSCCNGVDDRSCAGVHQTGSGKWVDLGTNPVYYCQPYVNPIICNAETSDCFHDYVQRYDDEACTIPYGSVTLYVVRIKQCVYDSCD